MTSTEYIYALELANRNYYVGRTNRPCVRMSEHIGINKGGALWTAKYQPYIVIEMFPVDAEKASVYETQKTKDYMQIYGVDNVRGGMYCSLELQSEAKRRLMIELYSLSPSTICMRCGIGEHDPHECNEMIDMFGNIIPTRDEICNRCFGISHKSGNECDFRNTTIYGKLCDRLYPLYDVDTGEYLPRFDPITDSDEVRSVIGFGIPITNYELHKDPKKPKKRKNITKMNRLRSLISVIDQLRNTLIRVVSIQYDILDIVRLYAMFIDFVNSHYVGTIPVNVIDHIRKRAIL